MIYVGDSNSESQDYDGRGDSPTAPYVQPAETAIVTKLNGMTVLPYDPNQAQSEDFKKVKIAESNIPTTITKTCEDNSGYCHAHSQFCDTPFYRSLCCKTCTERGFSVYLDDGQSVPAVPKPETKVAKKPSTQLTNPNTSTGSASSNSRPKTKSRRKSRGRNGQASRKSASTGTCVKDHRLCGGRRHKCAESATFKKLCCVTCAGL